VKWAWVVFDIGLLFALSHLTLRFNARWARGLALVIGCDAILTLLEALMFNLPRARTLPEVIGIVVAVAAPALAAVVLRNVWRRSLA
jgi:phosphatidylglycerol lysyltransferase